MKARTIGALMLSVLAALNLNAQQPAKDALNPLVGTWMWVETRNSITKETTEFRIPKGNRLFAVISDTHAIYGPIDPTTMKLVKADFGCVCTVEGNKWTERWDFGSDAGKTFKFEWKMEGEKLLKIDPKKGGGIQVWERFRPKSPEQLTPSEANKTAGQQLIDLKKAKDAGALTDEEYQAQKAKLLGNK